MGFILIGMRKAEFIGKKRPADYDTRFPQCLKIHQHPNMRSRLDGKPAGYYTSKQKVLDLDTLTSTGYSEWREILCRVVLGVKPERVWCRPHTYQHRPLYRLIHMSDSEYAFGPATCKSIHKDLLKFTADEIVKKAKNLGLNFDEEHFLFVHKRMTKAMEFGKDDGFVVFA